MKALSISAALLLLLLACGDDDGDDPPAPTTPVPTSATTETPTPTSEGEPTEDPGPSVDLLHAVPASVAVSSVYRDRADQVAHLADGDLLTAWNSRSGDLAGAWIDVRLPEGVTVTSIEMTAGFTKRASRDLFTGNHRVKKVRVLRDGTPLGEHELDIESRELQHIPIDGAGGDYRLVIVETAPGERDDWREVCISELRVMGHPGAVPTGARTPRFAVGTLLDLPPADATEVATEATPGDVEARVRSEMADVADGPVRTELLGQVRDIHIVKALVQDETEEALYVAVVPSEASEVVQMVALGTNEYEPGMEYVTELVSFDELAYDEEKGFVLADLTTRASSAEFATDGECQQRSQSATTVVGWRLVCGSLACVAIRTSLAVASPGFERDCDGHRSAPAEPDPEPHELRVELVDEESVRLTRVSGDVPAAQLGVVTFDDLPRERAARAF